MAWLATKPTPQTTTTPARMIASRRSRAVMIRSVSSFPSGGRVSTPLSRRGEGVTSAAADLGQRVLPRGPAVDVDVLLVDAAAGQFVHLGAVVRRPAGAGRPGQLRGQL